MRQMALRVSPIPTKFVQQIPNCHASLIPSTAIYHKKFGTRISCRKSINDAELASDLAVKVSKIDRQRVQREEAMIKSKRLLFTDFCKYLALKPEEVKKKWTKMDEEEKRSLVKGFVSEWGFNFHPLSARSVKDMVEEYLLEEKSLEEDKSQEKSAPTNFSGLGRLFGAFRK